MSSYKKAVVIAITCILSFGLQIYFFNNVTFFGVKANLILLLVLSLALWIKPNLSIPFIALIGITCDVVFTYSIGKNLIAYVVIMLGIMSMSKTYNRQNVGVVILITVISTIVLEYIFWIFDTVKYSDAQNLFLVLKVALKGAVINSLIQLINVKIYKRLMDE